MFGTPPSTHELRPWLIGCFAHLCLQSSFSEHRALSNHQRTCQRTKRRFSDILLKAQDVLAQKKRQQIDARSLPSQEVQVQELSAPECASPEPKCTPLEPEPSQSQPADISDIVVHPSVSLDICLRQNTITTFAKIELGSTFSNSLYKKDH